MQRRFPIAVLVALTISAGRLVFATPNANAVIDCVNTAEVTLAIPRSDRISLDVHASDTTWLDLQESGAEIELTGAVAGASFNEVTVPPRLGYFFLEMHGNNTLQVRRILASAAPARLHAKLHCSPTASDRARIVWFGRAALISQQLMPVSRGIPTDDLLGDITKLSADAVAADELALTQHLRAQALFAGARTTAAIAAFAQAESAWLAIGDNARALAARVGRVEELQRSGQYQAAQDLSKINFSIGPDDQYFSERLRAARCLALRYLGALDQAVACYEASITGFTNNDERTEHASMLLDLAEVLRYQGSHDRAQGYAQQGLLLAEGPDAPILHGRAYLLLADLALEHGDVATALRQFDSAISEFSSVHASRWEANAMLRVASLYSQFGVLDDSYAFVEAALSRLSEQDAPARFAAAKIALARVDLRAGQNDDALRSVRAAEAIYARLKMPAELDLCHTLLARLQLENNDVAAAEKLVDAASEHTKLNTHEWQLIAIRTAIAAAHLPVAQRLLDQLRPAPLSWAHRIEFAELNATWSARSGDRDKALQILTTAATNIHAAAFDMRHPLMAELLVRQITPLRSLAIELLLEQRESASGDDIAAVDRDTAQAAWQWINLLSAPRAPADANDSSRNPSTRLDELIGHELLASSNHRDDASATAMGRELLAILSNGSPHIASKDPAISRPLQTLQQGLAAEAVFVSFLDAGPRGAMLWISRDQARLLAAPSSKQLRDATEKLLLLVSSPGNSLEQIHLAGDVIAAKLFATAPMTSAPTKLLVDADSDIGLLPWPILRWREGDEELVENSSINLVHVRANCCVDSSSPTSRVHVFVSAQQATATASPELPQLPMASSEPDFITTSLLNSQHKVVAKSMNSRDALLAALNQSGDWVHIAGHGTAGSAHIGFSGVWLEPETAGAAPGFLGELDVLGRGSRSDLVVLDACQLGRRTNDSVRPSMSFADATAHAGAKHVVAALWPTSDSAAALWVPTFYADMASSNAPDVGAALHKAQLRLRSSRSFHHPFYWASLMHIESI
ncbi:CHAT domain-containing protein [Pseudolysobacter antarcticus]|uniref:CHAT domain-containing protein n=1 Tax=Pseudolysobacter antarcticus TaxID=2511995 RepID=A0A411HLL4_9GAMM|nr:CHAT domain-containing tetratricopeptide repeat protein [Pseudolysobacter antarcticus]QBB71267.1 CHAT domain-containing protein [Pseudolysobacter antarcticus]